MQRNVLNSSNN